MKVTIVSALLAAGTVAVGLAASSPAEARCWWNGYQTVCNDRTHDWRWQQRHRERFDGRYGERYDRRYDRRYGERYDRRQDRVRNQGQAPDRSRNQGEAPQPNVPIPNDRH